LAAAQQYAIAKINPKTPVDLHIFRNLAEVVVCAVIGQSRELLKKVTTTPNLTE
jgi:hypothetical protein